MKQKIKYVFALLFIVVTHLMSFGQQRFVSWSSYLSKWEASPMVSIKSHDFYTDTSSFSTPAIELGMVFVKGEFNVWKLRGGFPVGADWNYWGPYTSVEYGFNTRKSKLYNLNKNDLLSGGMLNIGLTGGAGAMVLIFPISINGTIAFSTNFSNSALKLGVGFNLKVLSFNMGTFIGKHVVGDSIYGGFVELKFLLWDKS